MATDPETTARAVNHLSRILAENFGMAGSGASQMATELVDGLVTRFSIETNDSVIPNAPARHDTGLVLTHQQSKVIAHALLEAKMALDALHSGHKEDDGFRPNVEAIGNVCHQTAAACDVIEVLVKAQRCTERAVQAAKDGR